MKCWKYLFVEISNNSIDDIIDDFDANETYEPFTRKHYSGILLSMYLLLFYIFICLL